jgi:hypothetical protein
VVPSAFADLAGRLDDLAHVVPLSRKSDWIFRWTGRNRCAPPIGGGSTEFRSVEPSPLSHRVLLGTAAVPKETMADGLDTDPLVLNHSSDIPQTRQGVGQLESWTSSAEGGNLVNLVNLSNRPGRSRSAQVIRCCWRRRATRGRDGAFSCRARTEGKTRRRPQSLSAN